MARSVRGPRSSTVPSVSHSSGSSQARARRGAAQLGTEERLNLDREVRRPHAGKHLNEAGILPAGLRLADRRQVEPLPLAKADLPGEGGAQLYGERVVVLVHMRDEEVADVAKPEAESRHRRRQLLPCLHQGHPRVDQVDAVRPYDRVDVHGVQRVAGQWQRDPVEAVAEVFRLRRGPGMPIVLSLATHRHPAFPRNTFT